MEWIRKERGKSFRVMLVCCMIAAVIAVPAIASLRIGYAKYWQYDGMEHLILFRSGRVSFTGVVIEPTSQAIKHKRSGFLTRVEFKDQRLGWYFYSPNATHKRNASNYHAAINLWMVIGVFLSAAGYIWLIRRKPEPWQCTKCRYDLRGLDGEVCPECGRSP